MRTLQTILEDEGRRSLQEAIAAINAANDAAEASHLQLLQLHTRSAVAVIDASWEVARAESGA